ncbi:MAG: hypothetical protein NPINA01_12620 [Nitrospinaceae bacterium]|nr:MAG: hypothetical protein NPINA01_12620 [Nitrospinaceae bacterium]
MQDQVSKKMQEQRKLAFDFARDTTKQLITLSTVIIAFTVTFSKDFLGTPDDFGRSLVVVSWISFLVSVIFGVWTLLALTGTLEPEGEGNEASIRGKNVTLPSLLQIICFLVGLGFTVWFGVRTA